MTRIALAALLLLPGSLQAPNFLIIVADDLGWRDVGYHGSEIRTPVLDRLASEGVRLERHYAYPVCSPTRAGLLTGRNPSRFGIRQAITGRSTQSLPPGTATLATLLKAHGYATAISGKWHLGQTLEAGPRKFGFDQSYGCLHGQLDPLRRSYSNADRTWHRNDAFVEEEGHVTDLIAQEAVRFLQAPRREPFFLYVPFTAAHVPLQEEDRWIAPYKDSIRDESRRLFAATVSHFDAAVGRIVEALEKSGQKENTLLLFMSDNGGLLAQRKTAEYDGRFGPYPTLSDNTPLRGAKAQLYEGGIRVPAFACWPGRLRPKGVQDVVSYLDWFPTLARLAGAEIPETAEGRNIWPLLSGDGPKPPVAPLYWNYASVSTALLEGDWKLICSLRNPKDVQLYDLTADPKEERNLAQEDPVRVAAMERRLSELRRQDP